MQLVPVEIVEFEQHRRINDLNITQTIQQCFNLLQSFPVSEVKFIFLCEKLLKRLDLNVDNN